MSNELKDYLEFKTRQLQRLTGFDTKQVNARAELGKLVKPMLKQWVAEAIASGVR